MKVTEDRMRYDRLQAPEEDGSVFVDPPVESTARLIDDLRLCSSESGALATRDDFATYDCQGRTFEDLARQARSELVAAAVAYTSSYRDVPAGLGGRETRRSPLVLTGHQPQLFHAGVWCKNFAAAQFAEKCGGLAVHLIIDSDNVKSTSLNVPGGSVQLPQLCSVPLDVPMGSLPYEERAIVDRQVFADFGRKASGTMNSLVARPMLTEFWPKAVARSQELNNFGLCLAQARHQVEGDWGLQTLELPQSHVCRSEPNWWFTAHVLAHLPRFVDIYNASLAEYRKSHRIRSAAHPVPDLASDGRRLEAPFWIWSVDRPARRALFVEQRGDELLLSDGRDLEFALKLSADGDANAAVSQLAELAERGVKLRTRALLTTMYARLLLSDLFVHGVGGAKYDLLTDVLIRRFLGLEPPQFVTVSGTLRLPIAHNIVRPAELQHIRQRLRQLKYQPERFLSDEGGAEDGERERWVINKRKWISTPQTRSNARTRCREIRRSNEALQPWVADQAGLWQQREEAVHEALRGEAILSSRDYAFCLHPEENLRSYLLDIVPGRL